MNIEKKYTPAECLKIIAAHHERATADYIKHGEPYLAVAMFGLGVAQFAAKGIRLEIHGERQGKRCGKAKAYVIVDYHCDRRERRTVDWDDVRHTIRVFNMDAHR